jgi:predicted 3-demethylubiquinone-9 3-methyltransferase (glyoxalase superfamily)
MTVAFELDGQNIGALNGGPIYKHTPAMSFFVWCQSEGEIDGLWQKLSSGGEVRMELSRYPWSEKYGWTRDRYGIEWQLILKAHRQKIAPALLFVREMFGKAQEAINFYMSLFENSKIGSMARDEASRSILHCVFSLAGQDFVIMDGQGAHDYAFSPAFSLVVNCKTQEEVDNYWNRLSDKGRPNQCGWLNDRFGVSWQVVAVALFELIDDRDPVKSQRAMRAMLKMKKLDIGELRQAYEGRVSEHGF